MPPQSIPPVAAPEPQPLQPDPVPSPQATPRPVYNPPVAQGAFPSAPAPRPAPVPPPAPRANPFVSSAFPPQTSGAMSTTPTFSGQQMPPQVPRSAFQPASRPEPRKSHGGIIALLIILILIIAGAAYAYYEQMWFFARPPYDTTQLASSIFAGLGKVNTSSYAVHLNVVSEPRDSDAIPFSEAVPQDTSKLDAYKRDLDRVRDVKSILQDLSTYYRTNKTYPVSLASLKSEYASLNKVTYVYSASDASSFSLAVQFESNDAVTSIVNSLKSYASAKDSVSSAKGKVVTFTKDSSTYLYLPSEPASASGVMSIAGVQQYLSIVPANFTIDGTLSGSSQKLDDKTINGKVRIAGTAEMADINVAIDAEFMKVADNFYVMVSKFPAFFVDISKLKGKWIQITPADVASYGSSFFNSSPKKAQDEITKTREQSTDRIKMFLEVADVHQALTVAGSPVQENLNGTSVYRYDLQFNKATLAEFYTDLAAKSKEKWGEDGFKIDQGLIDYLNSPEFDQVFNYMRKNTTLSVWADAQGIPVQAQYGIRLVPESTTKKTTNQVRATVTLTLSDVNQPIIISAPKDSMTVEDATIAITGQTKEQYQFSKQVSSISTVRSALMSYKQLAGVYPSKLDDLKKTVGEIKTDAKKVATPQKIPVASSYGYYAIPKDDAPILNEIPVDLNTHMPFGYSLKGDDFALTYTMQFPPYEAGTSPRSMYTTDYSSRVSSGKLMLIMNVVQGKNTATSKLTSQEAAAQSLIDSDKDGVSDALENYLGSNRLKADSDGDGHSDYDELTQGSNPLGPGNLKSSSSWGY